jgi:hypothetical protein
MRCCPGKKKGIKREIRAPRMLPRQRTEGEREELILKLQGMEVDELFSLRKGVTSFPNDSPSGFLPLVKACMVM